MTEMARERPIGKTGKHRMLFRPDTQAEIAEDRMAHPSRRRLRRLLRMRLQIAENHPDGPADRQASRSLILRSLPQAGVSKDGDSDSDAGSDRKGERNG